MKALFVTVVMAVAAVVSLSNANAAVGNRCNWISDCDLNEQCKPVPYYQRDGSSYTGVCVPKDW